MGLFERIPIHFALPDATLVYYPGFFDRCEADEWFVRLQKETPWQQDKITVFGRTHLQPRLTALYGNEGKPYGYSGIVMQPHQWTPLLIHIKTQVETACETTFTTVLLNYYRDGRDGNGWHADNEKELGRDPVIASVSLGAERWFHLRHNDDKNLKQKILLEHGSLLLMQGSTQHHWKHQIPKTARPMASRINLTFRVIR